MGVPFATSFPNLFGIWYEVCILFFRQVYLCYPWFINILWFCRFRQFLTMGGMCPSTSVTHYLSVRYGSQSHIESLLPTIHLQSDSLLPIIHLWDVSLLPIVHFPNLFWDVHNFLGMYSQGDVYLISKNNFVPFEKKKLVPCWLMYVTMSYIHCICVFSPGGGSNIGVY